MPKSKTRNRSKATLIAIALAALPFAADAAGLGKITVLSALGQPLKAELEVTATRDEVSSLAARVAPADAFRQAGIEYAPALSGLHFSREIKERGGRRYIEVTTDRPLNEPFVDMLVELSWASGRLVREYTFLLDPPELTQKMPAAAVATPEVSATTPAPVAAPAAVTESRPVTDGRLAVPKQSAKAAVEKPADKPVADKPAKTPAAAKPAGASTRTVAEGDTLGKIAAQTKPAGVSLDQMLVALFRNNADAFDGGNMNRLRAGKILTLPDAAVVSSIGAEDAHKEVIAQSSDFNAYRKKLAGAAAAQPAKPQVAAQSASGKITPKVEDKAPAVAAGKDKLQVSRTEAGKDAASKQAQGRISTLEEEAVARERALKEANSRVAALEKNLADLKKLAEMKSQAAADLQKQAQAAKPAPVEAKKPEPAPVKPAEPVKSTEAAKPVEAAKPAEATKPAEPAKPAEAAKPAEGDKPTEAPKPPPAPKKKVMPPPPPPEPDFIEENGPLVFGGGGVLALLLGWLGFGAYRRKKAAAAALAAQPIMPTDLSTHSVFAGVNEETPAASEHEPSQFSVSTMAAATQPKAVDPVIEADTFLAFGRDAQAEEILLDALKAEPQRYAIHMKLLEIYAARKNLGQFESIAKELHAQTGGSGPDWEKAAALGAGLDPENPLYGSKTQDFSATMVLSPEAAAAATAAASGGGEAVALEIDQPAASVSAEEAPVPAAQEAAALDFDLDLDLGSPAKEEAPAEVAAAQAAPQEAVALDFDLDLDLEKPAAPEPAPATEEPAPASDANALSIDFDMTPPAAEPAAVPADVGLDIALDIPAPEVAAAPAAEPAPLTLDIEIPDAVEAPAPQAPAAAPAAADANSIDFDFDLSLPAAEPAAEPAKMPELSLDLPAATEAVAPALDLSDISLELDTPAPAETGAELAAQSAAVEDNPEVATKIELAMAYEEMGDRDGARELLQEAFNEGSPAQKEVARAKLEALA